MTEPGTGHRVPSLLRMWWPKLFLYPLLIFVTPSPGLLCALMLLSVAAYVLYAYVECTGGTGKQPQPFPTRYLPFLAPLLLHTLYLLVCLITTRGPGIHVVYWNDVLSAAVAAFQHHGIPLCNMLWLAGFGAGSFLSQRKRGQPLPIFWLAATLLLCALSILLQAQVSLSGRR